MTKTTWDQHSIKAALHRSGMTLNALAELNGKARGSFSHVWKRGCRAAEDAIAKHLNVPVEELFPDRYPARASKILSSTNERLLKSQKGGGRADKASAASDRRAA